MSDVKGSAITARIRYVTEIWGDEGWERLRASLSPESQDALRRGVLPHTWVPFEVFVELCVKADAMYGAGDLGLCRDMAVYSADVNLTTLYRIFLKLGTPRFLLSKAPQLWSVHYSAGHLTLTEVPHGGILSIHDFDTPHQAHCLSVLGWAHRSVELSGGKEVESREERCRTRGDDLCELVLGWR